METRSQDPTAPGPAPGSEESNVGTAGFDKATDDESPGHAFRAAQQTVGQLREYIQYYIAAKLDALKLSARNAVIIAILAIVAAIAFSALVVTAVALLCIGMAQSISTLCRTGPWLGNLVTAILLLGGIALVARMGIKRISGQSRERTVKKYAARQQQQRAKFGEDVSTGRGPVD
jgi:membrane protein implicated in regulation of membrane protease activity